MSYQPHLGDRRISEFLNRITPEVVVFFTQKSWTCSFLTGVVVSNIFYIHPYLGKIPMLTNIFQMGWNHQLVKNLWRNDFQVEFAAVCFKKRMEGEAQEL